MKQRIKALSAKIKRFNSGINHYRKNWMFANNQGQFFQRFNNEDENDLCEIPNSVEAQTFWRSKWSEKKEHHRNAEWLRN